MHNFMSSENLRKELLQITEEPNISKHASILKDLSEKYINTIEILESDIPIDCRCLSYALGLAQKSEYVKIQRSSQEYIGEDLYAGKEFLEWLMSYHILEEISKSEIQVGDIILYFKANEWQHAGNVMRSNRVISKWGEGLLYEHDPIETPNNYGSELRYYKKIEPDYSCKMFAKFVTVKALGSKNEQSTWWLSQCGISEHGSVLRNDVPSSSAVDDTEVVPPVGI